MAREGCNLDKDEAEILKPSASSTSSSTPPPPPQSSQPSLFMKPPSQDLPTQRADIQIGTRKPEADPRVEVRIPAASPLASAGCKRKKEGEECPSPVRPSNRCTTCQKKVGLIGFRCRCGELFCPHHRYSDAHGCSYDYKAAGREEISKNNPVVRAAKIIKI